MKLNADVLILGSGIAGRTAAETIRTYAPHTSVLLISQEDSGLRPLLTKTSFQQIGTSSLLAMETGVPQLCAAVTELLPAEHIVRTSAGSVFYKKCIYALGSRSFIPPFSGSQTQGVYSIRTAADMAAIKNALPGVRQAVVIGGGVIGLEAGQMLAAYGIQVTILESAPYLMSRVLDPETAREYQNHLSSCHVETGVTISAICGDARVSDVVLSDGRHFPCQLVIVSCGVRANTAIAAAAGLDVQRGVVVSDQMQTSDPDIYACGDCVQFQGQCTALWKPAMEQGKTAALHLCGLDACYRPSSYPVLFYSPRGALFAMGNLGGSDSAALQVVTSRKWSSHPLLVNPRRGSTYQRLVYDGKQLVGAALIGDLSAMFELRKQITEGETKP